MVPLELGDMRILAWVLGLLAVVGSCCLGYNWAVARKGQRSAAMAAAKFAGDVSTWQSVVRLDRQNAESDVENAVLTLRGDELKVQIAELSGGRGLAKARSVQFLDRMLLRNAELVLGLKKDSDAIGEDSRVTEARERLEAATGSEHVYAACLARDEKLMYGLGVVWLAFGFALALAAKK